MRSTGSLCPKCGVRPRVCPGAPCSKCKVADNRSRRAALRAGAPKAVRIASVDAPQRRFTRTLEAKRYLITSAQNATAVEPQFWAALQRAAEFLKAELVVIPLRYKNPTSVWSTAQRSDEWWASEVQPFLFNTRKKLGPNIVLAADVKIQPTASSPLTGFDGLTGSESCILGHPKMQLRVVPSPTGRMPKILSTTGACTKRNYTDSRAGKLGAFHHFLGAVVLELEGKYFQIRQINADRLDGSFTDLEWHFSADAVRPAPPAAALALGDTHARFACPLVDQATFGPGGIVDTLQPEKTVWHDLFDGYAVNPYHAGDPFIGEAKAQAGYGDVAAEVKHAVEYVRARIRPGSEACIVPSNHDSFLGRWVRSTDWRGTGANRRFYLETALAMLKSARMGPGGTECVDPFKYWADHLKGTAPIRALELDESLSVLGIECGMHGDRGPNGAKGTLGNLSRLGARVITGHTHTPGIAEGHYQLGTSSPLKLEYAHGPSSWLNAHCVVYASGKRSLIFIIDGRWRLGQRAKRIPTPAVSPSVSA